MKNSIIKLLNISKIVLPIVLLNLFMNGCSEYEPLEEAEKNCVNISVTISASSLVESSGCADDVMIYAKIVSEEGNDVLTGNVQPLIDDYDYEFEDLFPAKYTVEIYELFNGQSYFIKEYTVNITETNSDNCDVIELVKELFMADLGC